MIAVHVADSFPFAIIFASYLTVFVTRIRIHIYSEYTHTYIRDWCEAVMVIATTWIHFSFFLSFSLVIFSPSPRIFFRFLRTCTYGAVYTNSRWSSGDAILHHMYATLCDRHSGFSPTSKQKFKETQSNIFEVDLDVTNPGLAFQQFMICEKILQM